MKELAENAGLAYDGNDVLFYETENICIFASDMTRAQYEKMERDINRYSIKGNGYSISGWHDVSGYSYWSKGDPNDSNYISLTAHISDPEIVDPVKLETDLKTAYVHFSSWDNTDTHDFKYGEEKKEKRAKPDKRLNILKRLGT